MHYYQFNVADYRKDTSPLTPVQHYIYRWLIDEYHLNEQPFNNDMPKLLWRMGLGENERESLELILDHFFEPAQDEDYTPQNLAEHPEYAQVGEYPEICQYWVHPRIERNIAEYKALQEKKSRAGKASGKARKQKTNSGLTPVQHDVDSVELTNNHKPITNNHKDQNNMSVLKKPTCKHKEIIQIYLETLPELPGIVEARYSGSVKEKNLKARWLEDEAHQDLEFWRAFFGIVRKNKFWMGENDRGWKADFEWLTKRVNFDKVIQYGME